MLAQSFLKPEVLGISEDEHRALVRVLGMLERGEIESRPAERKPFKNYLWMPGYLADLVPEICGTSGCIAGWAHSLSGGEIFKFVRGGDDYPYHSALSRLFTAEGAYNKRPITGEQAAIALRSYLTTGEPRWEEALS